MHILNSLNDINSIFNYIESKSVEDIISEVVSIYNIPLIQMCNHPMGGYSKGKTSGSYYFVIRDLKENINEYKWLYDRLFDYKSKEVLFNLIRYRLTANLNFIQIIFDANNDQYFDKEIVKCDGNEVFVDCGAYTGDTIESYIKNYSNYKKIYAYEPSYINMKQCIENTKKYKNIELKECGVGEINKVVNFSQTDSSSSVTNDTNGDLIEVVSIDEDINEQITYIKMDVECEEINAILGAKNHIKKHTPKLAICLYHIVSDLWEIPKLIDSINQDYRFYIRHYEEKLPWETVLYAISNKN